MVARHLEAPAFGLYSAYVLAAYLAVSAVSAWTISVFQVAQEKTPPYLSFVFWWQVFLVLIGLVLACGINHLAHWCDSYAPFLFGATFVLYDFGRKFLISLDKTPEALVLDSSTALLMLVSFGLFQNSGSRDVHEMLGLFAVVYFISIALTLLFSKPFSLQTQDIPTFRRAAYTRREMAVFHGAQSMVGGQFTAGGLRHLFGRHCIGRASPGAIAFRRFKRVAANF